MSHLAALYRHSLALLVDLYEITMAYGYWKGGMHRCEAVFHLSFRENPFGGGFSIACGLGTVAELLLQLRFRSDDLKYLAALEGNDGRPLFDRGFLEFLGKMEYPLDVDGVKEGTVVFPSEPLLRVKGPLIQCQILESALLNSINFQTLVATKAARVCRAARGEPVLEFGLRRAQGIDGSVAASRAAYVGGCAATSNLLAGKLFGIPVKGTHAHSWVMCFDDEMEAFQAYAEAMPNNCIFLVDTYDTLEGVRKAVRVGKGLRLRGHEMAGIRLDSGDLAPLSVEARRILDEGGFGNAAIVASNDLDEYRIERLKERGATIGVWGVGTRLATAFDQPALGGVYKLSAVRTAGKRWRYRLKLGEEGKKGSDPGILQVRRFWVDGKPVADAVYDVQNEPQGRCAVVDEADPSKITVVPAGTKFEDLLVPVFRSGQQVYVPPSAHEARARALGQLSEFDDSVRRLDRPGRYTVGLEQSLYELKKKIISKTRRQPTLERWAVAPNGGRRDGP